MDIEKFNALSLLSVPLQVSADPEMKDRTLMLARAVAEVFTELQLSNADLAARFNLDPEAFIIRLGDLNEQGLAFGREGFQRWFENTDRWTSEATLHKLKTTLKKQWEKSKLQKRSGA